MDEKLLTVIKDGREMQVNPNPDGLKELARFGWKVKPEVDDTAEQFKSLSEQCKAKGIKVVAADTIQTLTEKLSA